MSQIPYTEEEVKAFSSGLGVQVPDGCIIVGNSAGAGACVALSGDATISNAGVMNIPAAGGLFSSVASSEVETLSVDAGAISTTILRSDIVSAGAESRTIAAPSVANQLKIIFFKTDGGDVTIAGTNIYGKEATTATLGDAGDSIVLFSPNTTKWILISNSGVTFA